MYFGFKNISISYGEKEILKDVSLEFTKGKTTTLLGANGSGKTSLLKTVSKAVKATQGSAYFEGKPLNYYKPKELARSIAYLSQIHYSPPDIDVKTLVSYGRYPYKKFGKAMTKEDTEIIEKSIEMTGLKSLQNRTLATLSGGERQRAWIAMTICQQPEILILDEPITHLDIGYQLEVLELIKFLGEEMKITIVMVLHDINLAARYSHFIYALKDKRVFLKGTPKAVINQSNMMHIFDVDSQILEDTRNKSPLFIPEKHKKFY